MKPIILIQETDVFKKISSGLIAIWIINPFFTLYLNWFIYFKIISITVLLGVQKKYKFSSKGEQVCVITFLKIPIHKSVILKPEIEYISIFKTTTDSVYSLKVFHHKTHKTIFRTKNYYQLVNVASEISHLLKIDFFNPFEDYE